MKKPYCFTEVMNENKYNVVIACVYTSVYIKRLNQISVAMRFKLSVD